MTYAFMYRMSLKTKEEHEALQKVDSQIRATQDDFETGLPSFVRQFKAADE